MPNDRPWHPTPEQLERYGMYADYMAFEAWWSEKIAEQGGPQIDGMLDGAIAYAAMYQAFDAIGEPCQTKS